MEVFASGNAPATMPERPPVDFKQIGTGIGIQDSDGRGGESEPIRYLNTTNKPLIGRWNL
jgi:hypothetical protein